MGAAISTSLAGFVSFFIHSYFFQFYFSMNNIRNVIFGFPLIIIALMFAFKGNWFYIFIVYLVFSSLAWLINRKENFYDIETAVFFEKLGFPRFINKLTFKIYSSLLVGEGISIIR
jgi:hypothetical protein